MLSSIRTSISDSYFTLRRLSWLPGAILLWAALFLCLKGNPSHHLILLLMSLGALATVVAWTAARKKNFRCRWLVVPLCSIIILGFADVSQMIRSSDRQQAEVATLRGASSVKAQLEQRMTSDIKALGRLADRMATGMEVKQADWRRDASNYVRDGIEYQAVEWIDPSLQVKWVVPEKETKLPFTLIYYLKPNVARLSTKLVFKGR